MSTKIYVTDGVQLHVDDIGEGVPFVFIVYSWLASLLFNVLVPNEWLFYGRANCD